MSDADDPELRSAEEMAIVEEVMSVVRHDLRNRLATIRQAAHYLRAKSAGTELFEKDPRFPRFFAIIEEQVRLAESDLSKNEAMSKVYARHPRGTDPARIVQRALTGLEPERAQMSEIEPAELCADEAEIALALRHLVDNAIEEEAGVARVAGARQKDVYAFRVTNPGAAMGVERFEHLALPFVSEKAGRRGLGLSIARRVAERYGGGIRATNAGGGTTVELFLPQASTAGSR